MVLYLTREINLLDLVLRILPFLPKDGPQGYVLKFSPLPYALTQYPLLLEAIFLKHSS